MAWQQFLITILGNVGTFTFGLQAGWLSPLQPHLQSLNSPLGNDTLPLTDEEISWIGSIPSISGMCTPPIIGYIINRFGRKTALLVSTIPNLLSYLLLVFANNVTTLYIARAIGGFCSTGSYMICPIYVMELVKPGWRGTLGSLSGFSAKLGIISAYILGSYTSYLTLNLMSSSLTVIFVLFSVWIPESPVHLMKLNRRAEAELALRKIWGREEFENISEELNRLKLREESFDSKNLCKNVFSLFKEFATVRPLRNGIIIASSLFTFHNFCGYAAVIRYSVDIFNKAGTTYSSDLAAISLAVTQLTFSFVGAFLVDRVGRKRLILFALITMATCMSSLAIFLYVKNNFPDNHVMYGLRYLPTIAMILFMIGFASGFGSVPYIMVPDLFSAENRAFASSFINFWFGICEFTVIKVFPGLTSAIQLWGSLAVFASFNVAGAVFVYLVMFETKGLSYEEILKKLGGDVVSAENHKTETELEKM